jgi:Tfp pilus assembly protein PilO
VVTRRQELFALQRDLNLLDNILTDTDEKKSEIATAMRSLPSSFSEVSFAVGQFERLAQETGINLEVELDTNTKEEPGAVDSLETTLRTSSSYTSFSQMMSSLSSLPYHTRFDSIKLEGSGQSLSGLTSFRLYLPDNGN